MPERQSFGRYVSIKEIVEGRTFTMQMDRRLLRAYRYIAKKTGCTINVIANKPGKQYLVRKRFVDVLAETKEGFPERYGWQIATNTVREVENEKRVAIAVRSPNGEEGFTKFWLRVSARGQRAPRTPEKI